MEQAGRGIHGLNPRSGSGIAGQPRIMNDSLAVEKCEHQKSEYSQLRTFKSNSQCPFLLQTLIIRSDFHRKQNPPVSLAFTFRESIAVV